jgi:hypothetical protein
MCVLLSIFNLQTARSRTCTCTSPSLQPPLRLRLGLGVSPGYYWLTSH